MLEKYGGDGALEDWGRLMDYMQQEGGLSEAAQAIPSMALREDPWVVYTVLATNPKGAFTALRRGAELNDSFGVLRDKIGLKNQFVINWLDMLCFLLQGLPSEGTLSAVIAYMLADWYRPGVTLDYPEGGSGEIVKALVRAIEKNGGSVVCNAPVDEILVDDSGNVEGVRYHVRAGGNAADRYDSDGRLIAATSSSSSDVIKSKYVVSNCDLAMTRSLIKADVPGLDDDLEERKDGMPPLASFIHLHAGIDASGLPTSASADFPAQWAVVNDWNLNGGVEAPRNVVLVSMPSLIDPSLAPEGKHVIHAYVPATEPWDDWKDLEKGSPEYEAKKGEAADFLWSAVERYIPDARSRSDARVEQLGTPLTHRRFLRRHRGSYGPRVVAGKGTLPGHKLSGVNNLYATGDYTFPGIGVPATSSAGAIVANSIIGVGEHMKNLESVKLPEASAPTSSAADRIESVKAAIFGGLVSSVASAPFNYIASNFLLSPANPLGQFEYLTDMASITGAVFAITYRYVVREGDQGNDMLKMGAVSAFALTATLPAIEIPAYCGSIPLTCEYGYILDGGTIAQIAGAAIPAFASFKCAQIAVDKAIELGWIERFKSRSADS